MLAIFGPAGAGFRQQAKGILHGLYQFVLGLGGPGLFLLALADSSFLSIPEGNDLLIIVLSIGQSFETMAYYAAMTTAGSVTGCFLLYSVGRGGGGMIRRRLNPERLERVGKLYRRWGLLALVVPSILPPPTPFKVFVLSAGLFRVPRAKFLAAVAVGRSIRYFSWGILAVVYGESAKTFLERNLHTIGLVIFGLLVALILVWAFRRAWARRRSPQRETV